MLSEMNASVDRMRIGYLVDDIGSASNLVITLNHRPMDEQELSEQSLAQLQRTVSLSSSNDSGYMSETIHSSDHHPMQAPKDNNQQTTERKDEKEEEEEETPLSHPRHSPSHPTPLPHRTPPSSNPIKKPLPAHGKTRDNTPYQHWEINLIRYLREQHSERVSWGQIKDMFNANPHTRPRESAQAMNSCYYRNLLVPRRDCRGRIVVNAEGKVVMRELGVRDRASVVGHFWSEYHSLVTQCPEAILDVKLGASEESRRRAQQTIDRRRLSGFKLPGAWAEEQGNDNRPIWERAFDAEPDDEKKREEELVAFREHWGIEPIKTPWFYRPGDQYPGWYAWVDVDFPKEYYELLDKMGVKTEA